MNEPEQIILRELLCAGCEFASGKTLAEQLGVSRVAVWSHIEKLRKTGFEIEARPRVGYRLEKAPADLHLSYLRALLPETWQKTALFLHGTIDSTNSEAERLLAAGEPTPFVVLAREQTSGRGRLGRRWFSSDSGNLYLSFAFQPDLPPLRMQTFTLWMGASICDFINRREQIPVRLKWPNDLRLHEKKLAGMLTEARIDQDRIRSLVFGLGLNVNGTSFPDELRETATSLAAGAGRSLPLNEFAAALVTQILDSCRNFIENDDRTDLTRIWRLYDALYDRPVTATQGTKTISGIARGIDESGCLLLQQPDGSVQKVSAGDVTLRKSGRQS